jgi:GNAT superfamily N-acetyltransferase
MTTGSAAIAADQIVVRLISPADPISEITALLHRAYAPQVAMGLQPLAGRQDDSITRDRCLHSEAYLAILKGHGPKARDRIVGIILFNEVEKVTFPSFFLKPDVAHFAQFGVDPEMQGLGIGRLLLEKVEQRARETGHTELALSMAEPDRKLFDFYIKRGFRFIEHWKWPYTNYQSCILSKSLA